MIEITKELIGKEVLLQATGCPNSAIICNVVSKISPNGEFALLLGRTPRLHGSDVGWIKISTHRVLDVLE